MQVNNKYSKNHIQFTPYSSSSTLGDPGGGGGGWGVGGGGGGC